ncbi:Flp family type IVb pilin [Vibrio diazotrophicus]|uniref:Flp family type IVb pilin n=1 Tax=Vibrio diazotrophicus TaxID=685 RepID=UPI000C9E074D|nr:Flp family type IVb pilin [Vibrio diazotrophicus]PNH96864.1 fimbrial protein [Vibrio diazotrophicus]
MNKFIEQAKAFWQDEDGLSAVEYVVAGALVIAVLVGGFTTLGETLSDKLDQLNNDINPPAAE